NMENQAGLVRDGGILEYSRIHDMTIQAWSPFQYGFFEGVFVGNDEKFPELNARLLELAEQYKVTPSGIAVAFINRHPAKIQTVLGTMTPSRIIEATEAADIVLTREEWYSLYMAAGNILP
ncbi:MAG: aldo/keto reductase, partial [Pseudolactococcus laudensis]